MTVEACRMVASADEMVWNEEADLVIVGFGGAGVVAALEGLERGAQVLAVDRFGGGGATAYSGGIVYAGGTEQQRQAGYQDSAEAMFRYLQLEGVPVTPATLRRFCEQSAANLEWAASHGVSFGSELYSGKATYPPEGKFLYFCGNEKLPAFAAKAKPAPRGHRTRGKSFTGNLYYAALRQTALDKGVRLLTHAPTRRLVMNQQGCVLGIEIDQLPETAIASHQRLYRRVNPYLPLNGARAERAIARCAAFEHQAGVRRLSIRARQGVVLSSGGFIYSLPRLAEHRPDLAASHGALMRMGSMGCDGSGIALGESAGGVTRLMENAFVGRSLSPPQDFLHGLLVNRQGQRFINEDAYIGSVGNAIARQPGSSAWLIVDRATFWRGIRGAFGLGRGMFLYWGLPTLLNILLGGTRRGRHLDHLAQRCGIDAPALQASFATYHRALSSGTDDPFGKLADNRKALDQGPYYAIDVSTHNRFGATSAFTLGGLVVDENTGAVCRADGSSIAGLYAAGRCAVGLCSHAYMSGLSLADTLFSARRAAASALGTTRTSKNKKETRA